MLAQVASQTSEVLKKETWKEVPLEFEFNYRLAVSTKGNAILFTNEIKDGKIKKLSIENNRVNLCLSRYFINEDGKKCKKAHKFTIHLLIANTFIPNPDHLKFVIHKDGNVANNAIDNLYWTKFRLAGTKGEAKQSVELHKWEKAKLFFVDEKAQRKFAVTNFGRVILYFKEIADGRFIIPYIDNKGRPMITITPMDAARKSWVVHSLVATHFLPAAQPNQKFVIHLNHNIVDNYFSNLAWASQLEKSLHTKAHRKAQIQSGERKKEGIKLSETQVIHIKRLIKRGKVRNKMIAKQFGISEMAVYRIKRGENWAHVSIDNV